MKHEIQGILQDLVNHTHSLSILPLIKITGTDQETIIESMSDERTVILYAKTKLPIEEFQGVFGMANLEKLNLHLKNPEYKEGAIIQIVKEERNQIEVPVGLHFENAVGDFVNDFRFMNANIINQRLKTATFKGTTWDIDFEPMLTSINRLKLQSQAHSDESLFQVKTEKGNLIFFFGDASTHAGSFVFQPNVGYKLKNAWAWPVTQILNILNLNGDKSIKIADAGVMQITVDSGIAEYQYFLPGLSK